MRKPVSVFFIVMSLITCSELWADNFISPIPLTVDVDEKKVELGRMLFNDVRLSNKGNTSCASCHHLSKGGMDIKHPSIGTSGLALERNSPTVWNTRFNFLHTWDGRASSLHEQALMPIQNRDELGSSSRQMRKVLRSDKQYVKLFDELYDGKTVMKNVVDAIAEFQSSLIAVNSPFDNFLRGDDSAISAQQKNGYTLFKLYGCVSCHQGINVGGNMLQRFGVVSRLSEQHKKDLGRFKVSGLERDKHVFRVPSLRMAKYTSPYFHDGSVDTLEEAVETMAKYQLGRPL